MSAARALVAIAALAACGKGGASAGHGEDDVVAGTYVLVRAGATLTTTAAADPQRITLDPAAGPAAFRVVERAGDTVVVELLPVQGFASGPPQCTPPLGGLRGARLRFRVEIADLAPVLVRPVELTHADGTGVALEPGVPAGAAGAGGRRVCDVHCGTLEIPADAIGRAYAEPATPAPRPHRAAGEPAAFVETGAAGVALGRPLEVGAAPSFMPRHPETFAIEPRGDRALVTLAGRCTRWLALVPATAIVGGDHAGSYQRRAAPTGNPVARGTPLTWPDGSAAGEIDDNLELDLELGAELHPTADGQRVCVDRGVHHDHVGATPSVRMCVPATAVSRAAAP